MSKQPEALRIADALIYGDRYLFAVPAAHELRRLFAVPAAHELRRLHEVNAELLEALKEIRPVIIFQRDIIEGNKNPDAWSWPIGVIDAAIAKAEGDQA